MEGIKIRNALIQHAPKFDGLQPLDPWLQRINRYFEANNVQRRQRIDIAVWVLEGDASSFIGDLNDEDYPATMEELATLL